ncbi:hypothetical protein EN828_23260 [Mesorhizobium sp. M2D.F.Ca.ET.185.01.1.1]|uniref:hypothetical protein n=1 Tax=unclassified Mesorhizobium TaxID=325217 RepID=UPI000FCA3CC0|nr:MULTISPECIES: hypothetical protein [unclassified Mesorhizobium]TGP77101.1 hypothetical protein EN870_21055 [bacterium M00.F.Ca.ET.227.01.1.1]TGP84470.1 hypothetical protein EN864_29770 [bacterium M00.F.Ca.ET.221.01.1.1]TGP88617.1 hypothetical protein EN865_26710 [bacterium M00.F.Ca.ET.222.01.1.1]TGT70771.1 hypothetical protein EN802_20845 [bacterium M00.F.Ca.ET.159.01.1.1]TGT82414.1 hypothetical protein EN800_19005 [bacterium M00.F.Ca.ET.157.01.1.1]TGU03106.1 hypothetical protein EN806_426
MRLVLTLLLTLAGSAAYAASPEDDYIAARDKAIADITAQQSANTAIETIDAQNEKALADLQQRLTALLGPLSVKGFPATGTMNVQSLNASDIGYGMLDGLRYTQSDDGPSIVASTRGLTERWLKSKSSETEADFKLPADIGSALKLDSFYTQAIGSDAAFSGTLDFSLKKPDRADMVVARLGGWTQDAGPIYDQRVVVAVVKGDRVLIAEAPASPAVPKIAACDSIWAAADAAAQKTQQENQGSDQDDASASDPANAAWEKGDADYRACMAERLPGDPSFPALLKQAQNLADSMAGK